MSKLPIKNCLSRGSETRGNFLNKCYKFVFTHSGFGYITIFATWNNISGRVRKTCINPIYSYCLNTLSTVVARLTPQNEKLIFCQKELVTSYRCILTVLMKYKTWVQVFFSVVSRFQIRAACFFRLTPTVDLLMYYWFKDFFTNETTFRGHLLERAQGVCKQYIPCN